MFSTSVYVNRRKKLKELVGSGLILFPGNNDMPMNYPDNIYAFRQDSTFLYFFGHDMPELAAAIDVDDDADYFFGDDFDINMIIWTGPQEPMADKAKQVGAVHKSIRDYGKIIAAAQAKGQQIHILPPYRFDRKLWLGELLRVHPSKVTDFVSEKLIKACVQLRSIKEPCEIDEIVNAMPTAWEMHTTAMKMAKPGRFEYEVAGAVEGIALSAGGHVSFPVILTRNGHILHNHYHGNQLRLGDMMVCDAGCELGSHYATDHTRTVPVGGKFSAQQKEIYQIVLNANDAARTMSKAGVMHIDCHFMAAKTIASGLKDLGLMKGDIDEAVAAGAHALFFPHGLGHHMGLDVHDMEDYGENYVGYDHTIQRSTQFGLRSLRLAKKLEAGYVITNEPGLYFIPHLIDIWQAEGKHTAFLNYDAINKYRNFGGTRIEDDLLITEEGAEILGDRIPATINEVEEMANSIL